MLQSKQGSTAELRVKLPYLAQYLLYKKGDYNKDRAHEMEITIYVLAGEEKESRNLCHIVEEGCFRAISKKSLAEFKASGIDDTCLVVLLDLDSVSPDSSSLKNLKKEYPSATVITVSSERFHPHLKEAFENYIYASLVKPLDPDELFFFIESAAKDFG